MVKKTLIYGCCCIAALSLLVAAVPHYRQKFLTYAVDAVPAFYPLYQHGHQISKGTPLSRPDQQDMIVALSTPKYSKQANSHVYLIGKPFGKDGFTVIAQSPPLPKESDPQSITTYGGELIVANHQNVGNSIVIYDLKAAFSGELRTIGHIPNLPSPTSVLIQNGKLYVTCYGRYHMRGQGIYVYAKDSDGVWQQVQRYLYRDIFGHSAWSNDYAQWSDLAPIAMAVKDNIAYISNQHSSSIMLVDLTKPPEESLIGRIAGPDSRIYYPLGISFTNDGMYVAEHIHNYISELPIFTQGGDPTPKNIFWDKQDKMTPYDILTKNGYLFVASITSSQLYMFSTDAVEKNSPALIPLPDHAAITSLANINPAKPPANLHSSAFNDIR